MRHDYSGVHISGFNDPPIKFKLNCMEKGFLYLLLWTIEEYYTSSFVIFWPIFISRSQGQQGQSEGQKVITL